MTTWNRIEPLHTIDVRTKRHSISDFFFFFLKSQDYLKWVEARISDLTIKDNVNVGKVKEPFGTA